MLHSFIHIFLSYLFGCLLRTLTTDISVAIPFIFLLMAVYLNAYMQGAKSKE